MAGNKPQSYANHVRLHPPFHFFLMPAALLLLVLAIINVVRHAESLESWILLLIALMMPVAVVLIRVNALRVQDRVIRLEERLRLTTILAEPWRSRIAELTEQQLIALRFASDAEAQGLVEKALKEGTAARDIKKAIVNWRADVFRV